MSGLRVMMVGPYPMGGVPVGGVESAVDGLLRGLSGDTRIDSVHVLDFRSGLDRVSTESPLKGVTVHRIPAQSRLRLINDAARDFARLRDLVAAISPDVIHGQGVGLNGLHAVRAGVPSVVTVHGIVGRESRARSKSISDGLRIMALDRVVSRVLTHASAVISISRYDQNELAGSGLAAHNVLIPNAIPVLGPVAPATERQRALYAGVFIPRKNIVGLVRAFGLVRAELPDARLALAGPVTDAAYAVQVEHAIARYCPGAIDWLGPLDRSGIGDALAQSACLVLFSHQETLPVIIGEAMLCARPVVSTDVGGVSEMVLGGETGLLVADGDEQALASGLVELLSSQNTQERMGAAGHERAARLYSVEAVADRTIELYLEVVNSPR